MFMRSAIRGTASIKKAPVKGLGVIAEGRRENSPPDPRNKTIYKYVNKRGNFMTYLLCKIFFRFIFYIISAFRMKK